MLKKSSPWEWHRLFLSLFLSLVCVFSAAADTDNLSNTLGPSNQSNDCGCFRGSDTIPVSSGMLSPFIPKISNLELGFLYSFGNNVSAGRFSADYVLPFRLGIDSVVFGEAHAEGWGFRKTATVSVVAPGGFTTTTSPTSNRLDLSLGGGYRTMLGSNSLLGVNGFYDTSRLFDTWYSSGGLGLEMAANVADDDAIDLNFNWYGNLFNRDVLVNAFRNQGNSFDVEAGYSHAMFNQAMDLRLKLIGYQFDMGAPVRGWRAGADITTRDGMFVLRYEHGSDPINGEYDTVGGFVNIGFQLESLLSGASPFTLPEPVFRSPRNLRRLLGLKVKRNWHQPEAVGLARSGCNFSGYAIIAEFITPLTYYPTTPALPVLDSGITRVNICWCGAQGGFPSATYMIFDEAGIPWSSWTHPGGPTENGCKSWPVATSGHPTTHLSVVRIDPFGVPMRFKPGGGLSFQFE